MIFNEGIKIFLGLNLSELKFTYLLYVKLGLI